MSIQPASRTRFYRNKREGKVLGVCAGIADYTGLDVNLIRFMMVAAIIIGAGSVVPLYFIAGMIAPDRPRELDYTGGEDQQRFWQGVRASPARSARQIRSQLRDVNRRLADVESYVLSENRSLAREIEDQEGGGAHREQDGAKFRQ